MSPRDDQSRSDHIETATDPAAFAGWPAEILQEMHESGDNGCVGTTLVSETEDLRVWHLHLAPGARCRFHRHVNPYFWTALTDGRARAYVSDGTVIETDYYEGETRHYDYGPGEYMLHSLENIGDRVLSFVTVEHLRNPGAALPLPDAVRLQPPA